MVARPHRDRRARHSRARGRRPAAAAAMRVLGERPSSRAGTGRVIRQQGLDNRLRRRAVPLPRPDGERDSPPVPAYEKAGGRDPNLRCSRSNAGISERHSRHQVAQKLTRTTFPRSPASDTAWSSRVGPLNSGGLVSGSYAPRPRVARWAGVRCPPCAGDPSTTEATTQGHVIQRRTVDARSARLFTGQRALWPASGWVRSGRLP